MAESIKLKEILHLMKLRVLLYGWPCFSEMRPASLLKAIVAEGPQPPKKDGFKASLMTRTSDTVRTHLQRCRTLGEGLLKLCAHQSHTKAALSGGSTVIRGIIASEGRSLGTRLKFKFIHVLRCTKLERSLNTYILPKTNTISN